MNIIATGFDDLYVIDYNSFKDKRGEFVKTIHEPTFQQAGLAWAFTESFYSTSAKDVLRGMHFQKPPHDHEKLVYVVVGRILDVVLDLRKSSKTYGKCFSIELSAEKRNAVYIGKGFAHGFLSLAQDSIVEYHTTTVQSREAEGGILWNSFGFDWGCENLIISDRDSAFDAFDNQTTYFL